MTQTAVEWLYEQIQKDQYSDALSPLEWIKVIEQAKQMEKEQMKEAVLNQVTSHERFRKIFEEQFEKYYNETYGK